MGSHPGPIRETKLVTVCLAWWRSVGRQPTSKEVPGLIFRMVVENPTWGAPRIHGELLMLGFDVCPANDLSLDETGCPEIRSRPGAGLPFSVITVKRLPR